MPFIAKDGTIFGGASGGGGNSTSVEITYADYLALGDKVNSDGIDYYIIDPPESWNLPEHCKVRYIDDPSNENFDYIQVRTAEGSWKNYKKAYLERQWLVQDGLNRAGLKLVSSDYARGTLTQTDDFLVLYSGFYNDAKAHTTTFSFEETLDFTNYDKIVFEQSSTFAGVTRVGENCVTVCVKDMYGNILASQSGYNGTETYTDDIILDVSSIKEVGSIFIQVTTLFWTTTGESGSSTCNLSNVYAT